MFDVVFSACCSIASAILIYLAADFFSRRNDREDDPDGKLMGIAKSGVCLALAVIVTIAAFWLGPMDLLVHDYFIAWIALLFPPTYCSLRHWLDVRKHFRGNVSRSFNSRDLDGQALSIDVFADRKHKRMTADVYDNAGFLVELDAELLTVPASPRNQVEDEIVHQLFFGEKPLAYGYTLAASIGECQDMQALAAQPRLLLDIARLVLNAQRTIFPNDKAEYLVLLQQRGDGLHTAFQESGYGVIDLAGRGIHFRDHYIAVQHCHAFFDPDAARMLKEISQVIAQPDIPTAETPNDGEEAAAG